jgi:beta-lactamase regulating signal transducer with metallopeptidase domain
MIPYLINSTLCLAFLLIVYHLFLEREKMHQFNRAYLLMALFLAVASPLMPFGIDHNLISFSETQNTQELSEAVPAMNVTLSEGTTASLAPTAFISEQLIISLITIIYITGILILFLRFMIRLKSLVTTIRRNKKVLFGNSIVILLHERTGPFSFLNYIFVDNQEYLNGSIGQEILYHEQTHIRQKHTWDILAAETVRIVFWFNPLFYFLKRAMQLNHEFIADEAVIEKTGNRTRYQQILYRALQPARTATLASSFNFSLTKKRFLMMNRNRNNSDTLFKQTVAVTVLFTAMILFGMQADAQNQNQNRKTISIEIASSDVLKLNGDEIHLTHLEPLLSTFGNGREYIVHMKVHSDAFFGTVTDVQKILRKTDFRRLNYSSVRAERSDPETEALIEMQIAEARFIQSTESYMSIPVNNESITRLRASYNQVMQHFERLRNKQHVLYQLNPEIVPPPPPLPPNPETRLRNQN